MINRSITFLLLIGTLVSTSVMARENISSSPVKPGKTGGPFMKSAGCLPGTAKVDLDVNNVRTTILNGGDMWWDLSNAKYEIPKVQAGQVSKNSLFAGALWIGGVVSGNLRIAAQTYRQSGNDYYPGYLSIGTANVDAATCSAYDKIYKATLLDINDIRAGNFDNPPEWPAAKLPDGRYLAPFYDNDGDGEYNVTSGDYPSFDMNVNTNIPDMMLFIVYNDKGNNHTETYGAPIGLELQTTCFAYSTNDAINNMTFYRTVVYNRSNETIDSCIFGQWVDPDLGNYADDYVECDVDRNLGICYNGDDDDEGILGYGLNPPSIGVNFFSGPVRITHDTSGGNDIMDTTEIGLTKFVYYNNDNTQQGNPFRPSDYWNYLNGRWKDGTNITYGGNGKGGSDTASFMFPGTTDPANRPEWTERTAQNQVGDRRFLQTAGTFSLLPGSKNTVTIGVVWARAATGGATGSFALLKQASDKAEVLFKNNFKIVAGPDAPTVSVIEMDRSVILTISDADSIEKFNTNYAGSCTGLTNYKFQGYQIFQVKTQNIPSDFYDLSQARLVAVFDLVDGVTRLVNSINDVDLGEDVKKIMVTGSDNGIKHSIKITDDLFSTSSDKTMSNFTNYHYVVLAYASATNCSQDRLQYLPSRKTVNDIELKTYTATPHDPTPANNGTQLNAAYGDGFPVTQLEGIGNGGNFIDLSEQSIEEAMNPANGYRCVTRKYLPGYGPVNVKVIDPTRVPKAEFHLWMRDTSNNSKITDSLHRHSIWFMKNMSTGEVISGKNMIGNRFEQLFPQWGLAVEIKQSIMPGDAFNTEDISNGFIGSTVDWSKSSSQWLSYVIDEDPRFSPYPTYKAVFNWIRAGQFGTPDFKNGQFDDFADNKVPVDPKKKFAKMIDGAWSPYALAARWRTNSISTFPSFGPAWDGTIGTANLGQGTFSTDNQLDALHSVNFVITPDRSKWTRCLVIETGEYANLNQGGVEKMSFRKARSLDKNGMPGDGVVTNDPEDADYLSDSSMSWFPGYAIDVETGERLNLMFGEDSSLPTENGDDMKWNPSSNLLDPKTGRPVFGGKHFIYIMSSSHNFVSGSGSSQIKYTARPYDGGASYKCLMNVGCTDVITSQVSPTLLVRKRILFSQMMYTSMPIMNASESFTDMRYGLVPGEITYKFRVKRPYASYATTASTVNDSMPYFTLNTSEQAPTYSKAIGRKALDNVAVVPNPYYAYSVYEDAGNQLDVRIRITNLPTRCKVSIYTLNGVLVRTIKKDDASASYLEWDMKNDAKVPISSGVYLIHINATDLGEERVIKWFGVLRPSDFDTF